MSVSLSRTCHKTEPASVWRFPSLALGCGVVLTVLGLLTLLLATAGFLLEREVQASGSAFLAGSLAMGSGLSGCLVSRGFYSRQTAPLSLVEESRDSALIGRGLQSVTCANNLMP